MAESKWKNKIVGHGEIDPKLIKLNEMNPKNHPIEQREMMDDILDEIGWTDEVKINKRTGNLVDGEMRVTNAIANNESTVPVTYLDLSEEEELKMLLTFNQVSYLSKKRSDRISEIEKNISFDSERLKNQFANIKKSMEDGVNRINLSAYDELTEEIGVSNGQIWKLDNHIVACGDSTDKSFVDEVFKISFADMTFTSPPYNIGKSASLSGHTESSGLYSGGVNDNKTDDEYFNFLKLFTDISLEKSKYVFVNLGFLAGNKRPVISYMNHFVDRLADIAIWDKGHAPPQQAEKVMNSRFEFIIILSGENASRAIGTRKFRGDVDNIYNGGKQNSNPFADIHSATFPIELPLHFITNFTNENNTVYDPFLGTGTTLMACDISNRNCVGIDKDEKFCAISINRWQKDKNKKAERIL